MTTPTREQVIAWFESAGVSAGWKPGAGNPLVINYLTHFAAAARADLEARIRHLELALADAEALELGTAEKLSVVSIGLKAASKHRDELLSALEKQVTDARHCQQVMLNETGIGFLDAITLENSEAVISAVKGDQL